MGWVNRQGLPDDHRNKRMAARIREGAILCTATRQELRIWVKHTLPKSRLTVTVFAQFARASILCAMVWYFCTLRQEVLHHSSRGQVSKRL